MAKKNKEPQEAETEYQRVSLFELPYPVSRYPSARYSLVKLMPKTGRKHQLRRHLAHINHPIVGDTTHGDGKHNVFVRDTFGLNQLALMCKSMVIMHPITHEKLHIQAKLDKNLAEVLEKWEFDHHQLASLEKL